MKILYSLRFIFPSGCGKVLVSLFIPASWKFGHSCGIDSWPSTGVSLFTLLFYLAKISPYCVHYRY